MIYEDTTYCTVGLVPLTIDEVSLIEDGVPLIVYEGVTDCR